MHFDVVLLFSIINNVHEIYLLEKNEDQIRNLAIA